MSQAELNVWLGSTRLADKPARLSSLRSRVGFARLDSTRLTHELARKLNESSQSKFHNLKIKNLVY